MRLDGETLVARAVRHARESGVCDRIVVTTDSADIADEARRVLEGGHQRPGVRRVRHDDELVLGQPPHDDVVDDVRVDLVEQVGVLRATRLDPVEVVRERPLEGRLRPVPRDAQRSEVRHVEHHGVLTAGPVLLEDSAVLDGHLPAAERRHPGAELEVHLVERTVPQLIAHAVSAMRGASGGRPRSRGRGPATACCDGASSPYFTSRCR